MGKARIRFWRRAQAEGWTPRERCAWRAVAPGPEDLPPGYRVSGACPGSWSPEAQRTPEWRAWRKARDLVYEDHGGLVVFFARAPTIRHRGADLEEVWQEARLNLLRGIDLWDPDRQHPTTGAPLCPATYLGRWIRKGISDGMRRWLGSQKNEALASDDAEHEGYLGDPASDLADLIDAGSLEDLLRATA